MRVNSIPTLSSARSDAEIDLSSRYFAIALDRDANAFRFTRSDGLRKRLLFRDQLVLFDRLHEKGALQLPSHVHGSRHYWGLHARSTPASSASRKARVHRRPKPSLRQRGRQLDEPENVRGVQGFECVSVVSDHVPVNGHSHHRLFRRRACDGMRFSTWRKGSARNERHLVFALFTTLKENYFGCKPLWRVLKVLSNV